MIGQLPPPEEWRPVVGWEEKYEVSSHGRVRRRAKILKPSPARGRKKRNQTPYNKVSLGGRGSQYVHKLVALAFLGPPPKDEFGPLQVHHVNTDSLDNHATNLQYVTQRDNLADQQSRYYRGKSGQDWPNEIEEALDRKAEKELERRRP